MGQTTEIAWTDATFNPWWGCEKVSAGCTNCYAAAFDKRVGGAHWGGNAPRRFFGDKYWQKPLKWNTEAEKAGVRRRVFCASMADVFEDREDLREPRARLFQLIQKTPWLDWQLLTKRPNRIIPCLDSIAYAASDENTPELQRFVCDWLNGDVPANVWIGTTVEDMRVINRVEQIIQVPAAVRFLSVEPMLGPVELPWWLLYKQPVHWVICGAESGGKRRPFQIEWAQQLHDQCKAADVAFFMKQGSHMQSGQQAGIPDELWNCKEFPNVAVTA